jgi:hypothetical protein
VALLAAAALGLAASCSASDDVNPASGGATGTGGRTGSGGTAGASGGRLSQAGQPDFSAPAVCTSKKTWTRGEEGSELMHPGRACLACHATNDGPELAIAGTAFPSAHEPDDCNGVGKDSGVSVVITDADGVEHRLSVNAAGNFKLEGRFAFPYHAQIEARGLLRAMVSPQLSGDCNGCHSQQGSNGAPGRIVAP